MVPQPILDQLNVVQNLKDTADASTQAKAQADAAVTAAQSDAQAKANQLASDTTALAGGLQKLEAIIDAYYRPGVPPPLAAPTPPP
jgi:hypothetical protein